MVVEEIDGVVKLVPVPSDDPPVAVAYQLMVPAEATAPKFTVPAPHLDAGAVLVMVGSAFKDTVVESSTAQPFTSVTVTVYLPAIAVTTGFCKMDTTVYVGSDQLNEGEMALPVFEYKFTLLPVHTGELLPEVTIKAV